MTPVPTLSSGLFVTGTDTGVGKTVATSAIACAQAAAGRRVAVLKAAQTGVAAGEPGDVDFALAALASEQPAALACPRRYAAPAAPLVAAWAEGARVAIGPIAEAYATLAHAHDLVLVEGAGGLLVPLAAGWSMADLARYLRLPLVVVARPTLGTLNHTLLTLEAARARGLVVLGLVLAGWRDTDDLATLTNPALLVALGRVPLLGVLPWDPALSTERGQLGGLRQWCRAALAPLLGGQFDAAAFLAACAARAAALTGQPVARLEHPAVGDGTAGLA
jgi:dethiobiotin synthetase